MCPQKWKASARSASSAAATKPPPLTASSRRPARARKPRRDVASATDSLSIYRSCRGDEQALQLVERVERALREHLAVRREDDSIRAAGILELGPRSGVSLLVEELQLHLRV